MAPKAVQLLGRGAWAGWGGSGGARGESGGLGRWGYLHEELEGAVITHTTLPPCLPCQRPEPGAGHPELVVGRAQPLQPPPLLPCQEPCRASITICPPMMSPASPHDITHCPIMSLPTALTSSDIGMPHWCHSTEVRGT